MYRQLFLYPKLTGTTYGLLSSDSAILHTEAFLIIDWIKFKSLISLSFLRTLISTLFTIQINN